MKGDFTRDTFDPARNFSRVLMQQGRVQLDSDWNEQIAILLYYVRTLATDILGAHAGPAGELGFDFITQNTLDAWTAAGRDDWKLLEPDTPRREALALALKNGNAAIGPGRYYVHGILVENRRPLLYTEQRGYPFSDATKLEALTDKELLVYLDVWERHLTHVEDDRIREVALGGADTSSRAQVVWQVKVLPNDGALPAGTPFDGERLDALLRRSQVPLLRARARRAARSAELCSVSPEARYRGLENQLYRVEVHTVTGSQSTFKWSRDNGSVVFPVASLAGNTAVLETLGRDASTGLEPGDWVELGDDVLALREVAGRLARVEAVDREERKVTLRWAQGTGPEPAYTEDDVKTLHPSLRRWDHSGDPAANGGALALHESKPSDERWLDLEDGVQVSFAPGGEYRPGDYWLIPARVATGDVDWPSEATPQKAAALPPHGPKHHYAPLVTRAAGGATTDSRSRIPDPV
jgi:hypothetical protein